MDKLKILITGARGFIGRNLLDRLSYNENYELFTITKSKFDIYSTKNFVADITDKDKIEKILKEVKPDIIVHLAAVGVKYGEGSLENIFKVNTFSIINVLEICKSINLRPKTIVAGSGFEYELKDKPLKETDCLNPLSIYGISKATQSMLLKRYARDFTIFVLRFFSVYGKGEAKHRFFPYILSQTIEGRSVKLTGCEQVRDFLNVEDAAKCIEEFIKKEEEKNGFYDFNVATGRGIRLKDAVNIIREILSEYGYKPKIEFGALPYREDEPMYYVADIQKIKKYLNWEPSISLEKGLRAMVEEQINELKR